MLLSQVPHSTHEEEETPKERDGGQQVESGSASRYKEPCKQAAQNDGSERQGPSLQRQRGCETGTRFGVLGTFGASLELSHGNLSLRDQSDRPDPRVLTNNFVVNTRRRVSFDARHQDPLLQDSIRHT